MESGENYGYRQAKGSHLLYFAAADLKNVNRLHEFLVASADAWQLANIDPVQFPLAGTVQEVDLCLRKWYSARCLVVLVDDASQCTGVVPRHFAV